MPNHPTEAELIELVHHGLSRERSRSVVSHLLRGCAKCNRALAPHIEGLVGEGSLYGSLPPDTTGEGYGEVLERAFASACGLRADLPPLDTPEGRKRHALVLLVRGGIDALSEAPREILGIPAYEALLERSWALRHDNPEQMVKLARCAAMLAESLRGQELGGDVQAADLRCRAWTELANAYRVADELDLADDALDRATHHFLLGTRDSFLGARFFDVLASQLAARRFFQMACNTLTLVAEVYQQKGDQHLAGRALIMKGIFAGYQGDPEEAIRGIESGVALVDAERDPGLLFAALQSQAWLLVDCGRFRDARLKLWDIRRRGLDPGGRVNELKLRWLEGHIFAGLEQLDRAEHALRQVKEGFAAANLRFKAALAGLELGALWLRQNRYDDAITVVMESTDVFLTLRIEREVLASVLLLRKAGELRKLTLLFLNKVIETLHQAERDPNARPQPAVQP